jgi:hypothetical protein
MLSNIPPTHTPASYQSICLSTQQLGPKNIGLCVARSQNRRPLGLQAPRYDNACALKSPGHRKQRTSIEIRRVRKAPKLLLHRLTEHTLHRREHRRNTCKLRIEIARIRRARNSRDKGRRHPLVVDIVPVDVPEEGVGHDFLGVRGPGAEAHFGFAGEEFLQDGDGVARHVDGVQGLVGQDGVVDFVFVFAAEGGLLEEHLVDEHAKGPPVDCAAVFLVEENLRIWGKRMEYVVEKGCLPLVP